MDIRRVVMQTLRLLFDRAAESFRKEPAGDHYFDSLHSAMIALRYASGLTDAALTKILGDTEPRYFVRELCMHREQEHHRDRWG